MERDIFSLTVEADNGKEYDIKQPFFTNLLLLGFEAKSFEIKYRTPFNKDMFNLPNKTGSEAVLYFLFDKLDPIMCKEEFRCICGWPISNKKDEQQFRRVCNSWLLNIQKEEPESHLPRVAASLFMSPGGDKFYQLLFHFSNYVLSEVIKRENGVKSFLSYPEVTHKTVQLDDVIGKTVQCASIRYRKQYFNQLQDRLRANNEWEEYSSELVKEYRQLTKKIRDLERDVRTEIQTSVERSQVRGSPVSSRRKSTSFDFDLDSQVVRRTQRIQKLRDMWKEVERFQTRDSKDREIVESILERTINKEKQVIPGISATDLNIKIPDLLLRECETEIHRRHVDNTYKGGKLNLLSVIQLWNLSLHLYIDHLHKVSLQDIESENTTVTTQLHAHNAHLTNAQNLREKLSEDLLPQLKQSIKNLRHELDSTTILPQHATPNASRITSLGFELSAPTPPVSFTPKEDGNHPTKNIISRDTPTPVISTPEAANQILDTVLQTSQKTAQKYQHSCPVYISTINSGIPVSNRNINNSKSLSINDHLPSRPDVQSHVKKSKKIPLESNCSAVKSSTSSRNTVNVSRITSKPTTETSTVKYGLNPSTTQAQLHNTPAKIPLPASHNILIDKIVSAVVDDSPDQISSSPNNLDINLLNPLQALDETVFVSRNMIGRSPDANVTEENTMHTESTIDQITFNHHPTFGSENTRLRLSFNEELEHLNDKPVREITSVSNETVDNTNDLKPRLTISELNDSGLLTLTSDNHEEEMCLVSVSPSILAEISAQHYLNLSKEDLMTADNPVRDSLLNLDVFSLEDEIPNLIASPPFDKSESSTALSGLGLTSCDAELDDIFNTKTPKIRHGIRNYSSIASVISDKDRPVFDSLSDEQPVTLLSFSPPIQPSSQLTTNQNYIEKNEISRNGKHYISNVSFNSVETSQPGPLMQTCRNSDLLDIDELTDILDLNDSFAPLKEGVRLIGASPGKLSKSNIHRPSDNSSIDLPVDDDITERCRRLRKATSETLRRVSMEINDVIARTDKNIHAKERELLSTSSDDIMSDLSRKYLKPQTTNGDYSSLFGFSDSLNQLQDSQKDVTKLITSHDSHLDILTNCDLNEDIFAEDDTLLLPASPSNY